MTRQKKSHGSFHRNLPIGVIRTVFRGGIILPHQLREGVVVVLVRHVVRILRRFSGQPVSREWANSGMVTIRFSGAGDQAGAVI